MTTASWERMLAAGARGPSAVAVPGSVAGLLLAAERFGRLPREALVAPALALARDGFPLGAVQAHALARAYPDLARDPAARRVFGQGGRPRRAGERLLQPELADTLQRIAAEGARGFYEGHVAGAIAAAGGHVALADLSGYRAEIREPLRGGYRGLTLETAPLPAGGGVALLAALGLIEHLAPGGLPPSPAGEHLLAEALRRAQAVKRLEVGDGAELRPDILVPAALLSRTAPFDADRATPSPRVHPGYAAAARELEHTTHLSVVDREGSVVALTTTLSASYGARVVVAGVVLNNTLAAFGSTGENRLRPGRRPTTSMAPTLLSDAQGPRYVLGTPGGDTIPSTLAGLVVRLVDRQEPLDDAVDAPRLHHGFVPDALRVEAARPFPAAFTRAMRRLGHRLTAPTPFFGDANCVVVGDGEAAGYADPREQGVVAVAR